VENELLENINRNLEVVIALLLRSLPGADAASLQDRALMLEAIGMRPKDMAKVLGKSANHINKELSVAGARRRRGNLKNEKA
jgi:hypothetical protein